ncbi:amino acid ABC transporter permease [Clostridium formicaceticum]|uniref:Amino-acid permease protein YxeN n=2 Tax=Clostridium formicaceticum TaxID=1497 RepID=A0AAC9RM29_9CLOT|nr:putative amino-acid permease protein YxeN [Clostridium formicaceticum]
MVNFDIQFALRLVPLMMQYLKVTLLLSVLTMIIGLIIAFIISLIIDARITFLSPLMKIYVSFFRGTPLLAQLFLLYFGLAQVIPVLLKLSAFNAALIVLSLNSAAFMSEAIRGAIMGIDKGQMEACMSIGMTYWQAMRRIILPQAIRTAIPALSNSFINIVKSSSLAYTIGVTEMMAMAQLEAASSYRYLEAFVVIILVYWLIISVLTYMQDKLELRLNQY